jgi:cell pole-organizing protein PopZ
MEEILASIRRIIADEDTGKAPAKPAPAPPPVAAAPKPVPPPAPPPPKPAAPPPAAANNQNDIDAMLADLDVAPKAPPPPPKPVAVEPPPPPDVLDLTEAMAAPAPGPGAAFRTIDAASDVVFTDRPPEAPAEPAPRPFEEPRRPAAVSFEPDQRLISNATVSAVDSAFNALAHTVLGNNARTLEDLVKEMLRPMLKNWLDDNLPNLVERIVRAEIERVSRGRS